MEEAAARSEDRMLAGLVESELSDSIEKMLSCLNPVDRELFLKLYALKRRVKYQKKFDNKYKLFYKILAISLI